MANTIKLKRGSGSDPSASDLSVGEIAIRTDSGKLFTKKDDGSVAEISGSGGSGTTINNNADNRVITGSGTANTLNGESTFTYDGAGVLTLLSTDTGSSALPIIELYRNSASPADADYLGQIKFTGESDDGSKEVYAKITGKIGDASSGTEDGIIEIAHTKAGSNNISARFTSTDLKLINGTGLEVAGNTTLSGDLEISSTIPKLILSDSDHNPDFEINANAGNFTIKDVTNNASRIYIEPSGTINLANNVNALAGLDATGALTASTFVIAPKILGNNGIIEMKAIISSDHTLTSGYNAIAVDPSIANGVTVTVPSGAIWSIV